jgi:hypothetical protein
VEEEEDISRLEAFTSFAGEGKTALHWTIFRSTSLHSRLRVALAVRAEVRATGGSLSRWRNPSETQELAEDASWSE